MKFKVNKKKVYAVVYRFAVSVLLVLLVAIVPSMYFSFKSPIADKFAPKGEFQGVLELWNIDTFEGGTASKTQFLKQRAIEFEKANKGTYIMVKNMTEKECLFALENGQMPAMFSFAVGVGEKILKYLSPMPDLEGNIRAEFLSAGKNQSGLYAVPWCRGVYSLISTTNKLEKAKVEPQEGLSKVATSSGYQTTLKNKKIKTTYSLSFGSAGYVCPQLAYSTSFQKLVKNSTSIDLKNLSKTQYEAYCDFVENKASILLGTQRDVARIENRISQGKIDGVIYEHLSSYTDLVQFAGICNTNSEQIFNACVAFTSFLISNSCQKKLSNIGMFSVCDENIYFSGVWQQIEQETLSECVVQNVFSSAKELADNKESCIDIQQI